MTNDQAIAYLTARYEQQCELFPATRTIPLELYIRRNVKAVLLNAERAERKARQAEERSARWTMTEARRLALQAVKAGIRARGDRVSLYSHGSLVAMANQSISPFLVAQARLNLAKACARRHEPPRAKPLIRLGNVDCHRSRSNSHSNDGQKPRGIIK